MSRLSHKQSLLVVAEADRESQSPEMTALSRYFTKNPVHISSLTLMSW